jgi:hypothetical protein
MQGRFEPTAAGFIMEGEVSTTSAVGAACSVTAVELDGHCNAAHRSLFEALKQFEGQHVRISVEVVEHRPIEALREAIEHFRRDAEEPDEYEEPDAYSNVA